MFKEALEFLVDVRDLIDLVIRFPVLVKEPEFLPLVLLLSNFIDLGNYSCWHGDFCEQSPLEHPPRVETV